MAKLTGLEIAALTDAVERGRMSCRLFRPHEQQEPFFRDNESRYTVLSGGNRSGKSTCAAMKFASIATDTPITLRDGTQIHCRRPHQRGKCLTMWCIGYGQNHIGQTLHRLLFRSGLFDITYDKDSKKLRAWEHGVDDPDKVKKKPSPALIPGRFIAKTVWESAGERIFSRVDIIDPVTKQPLAEIFAYGSKGEPKQGEAVDVIWIDEQLGIDGYLSELKARLIDRSGFLFWSSWPDMESEQLEQMVEICKKEAESPTPIAKLYTISMSGNKANDAESVRQYLATVSSPEEALARDQGLFLTDQYRQYPQFDKRKSQFMAICDDRNLEDEVSRILRNNAGEPPLDWTRELILDPGTKHPCVLLCAIPPKTLGEYYIVYDEVYPGRADPWKLAHLTKQRVGYYSINRFIGDRRAGRQQAMGMMEGYKVFDAYTEAFAQFGLKCNRTGSSFLPACDDPYARSMALTSLLAVDAKGFAKIRVVIEKCPNLCEQITKAKKKVIKKEVSEDRRATGTFDALDCIEYWAASKPEYEPPPTNSSIAGTDNWRWLRKKFDGGYNQANKPVHLGTRY